MPFKRMNRFGGSSSPHQLWLWLDDPAEDAGCSAFMAASGYRDAFVDRTGSTAALSWQLYDSFWDPMVNDYVQTPTGVWDSEPLIEDAYTNPNGIPTPWEGYFRPLPIDVAGFWECDQYGRPYNLNDLLA